MDRVPAVVRWAFVSVLLGAGIAGAWYLVRSPHGDWDAWAIWNLRARSLYRGADWSVAFSPLIRWSHPDYPLLLPSAVARAWAYAGGESTLEPRLLAVLFGAATAGVLTSALAVLRGPAQGCLGGLVLLATPYFVELTTAQYADVPLGLYILAASAALEAHDRAGGAGWRLPLLAGVLASLAAWTKNEGALFLVATVLVRLVSAARRRREAPAELAALALGLLPVGLVLVYFKLRWAPVNDLVAGQGREATRARLLDVWRYAVIAGWFVRALAAIGPGAVAVLAAYRWLLGPAPRRPGPPHAALVVALMLAGYALVYLTTPNDLAVHLRDSVHRLFMQLWPTALLAFFLSTAAPGEIERG